MKNLGLRGKYTSFCLLMTEYQYTATFAQLLDNLTGLKVVVKNVDEVIDDLY